MALPDLKSIAKNAVKDSYSLDRIPWHRGVDPSVHHFPEVLTPLFHCYSYSQILDEEDRLVYNQLFAQYVCEQFIFLEDRFLCRVVEQLLPWAAQVSWDLKACLEIFLDEEVKHTEMFRRLQRASDPERYATSDFFFLKIRAHEDALIRLMASYPKTLHFWIFVALLFEEKTIDYFTHYRTQQRNSSLPQLDQLHTQVHKFHMMDEARHVQIDEHLLNFIFNRATPSLRFFNIHLLKLMMTNYTNPKRANMNIIRELCRLQPRLRTHQERICGEVRQQNGRSPYQMAQFSRKNFPKTFSYFDGDSQLRRAMRSVILTYNPDELPKSA
jgi:hypothetical protein